MAEAALLSDGLRVVAVMGQGAAHLGREPAAARCVIEDTQKVATVQATAMQALARQLHEVVQAQADIRNEVGAGLAAFAHVGQAVHGLSVEVGGIVDTLKQVSGAAPRRPWTLRSSARHRCWAFQSG